MGCIATYFDEPGWKFDLFFTVSELLYASINQWVLLQYRILYGGNYSVSVYLFNIINMILFRNRSEVGNGLSTVAALRLNKDLEELATKRFSTDYTQFNVSMPYLDQTHICLPVLFKVKNESGSVYSDAVFDALIQISPAYPFKPPSMVVRNQVYHPNIDIDTGLVSLSVLKESDWKPVFTINTIIFAFELVLYSPDFNCTPINDENIEMKNVFFRQNEEFYNRVRFTLQGGLVLNKYFFEYNYGKPPQLKRNRRKSIENTKKFRFDRDAYGMNIEICLKNN